MDDPAGSPGPIEAPGFDETVNAVVAPLTELVDQKEIFGYRDGASWKFKPAELDRVATERGLGAAKDVEDDVVGGSGLGLATDDDEDLITHLLQTSAHAYLLFFSNRGKVYRIKAHQVPITSRQSRGMALVNLLQLEPDERV